LTGWGNSSSCYKTGFSMIKNLILIIYFFTPFFVFTNGNREPVVNVSISLQEQYKNGYFILRSSDSKLTVIGISNSMLRRQDEIAAAKEDAARKIAMYFGIQGSIEVINSTSGNFFDYVHDSSAELIYLTNYEQYIDKLIFDPQIDVLTTNEGVFIRFQYEVTVSDINYSARIQSGRPVWTRNQGRPEIEGYVTSVGFSRNRQKLKDTVLRATEDAVERMIADLSTTVKTREVSATGQGSSSVVQTRSEGKISEFRIIEIWIEPDSRSVYTLAIGKGE